MTAWILSSNRSLKSRATNFSCFKRAKCSFGNFLTVRIKVGSGLFFRMSLFSKPERCLILSSRLLKCQASRPSVQIGPPTAIRLGFDPNLACPGHI
jgi:hypothetical protein